MKAQGLFFLRYPATTGIAKDGTRSVLLPVVERNGHRTQRATFVWAGTEAARWYEQHITQLRAGTPLQIEADHIQPQKGELFGLVTRCDIAAARWQ